MAFAYGWHIELMTEALYIINSRQATYLVVALHIPQSQIRWRDVYARHLIIVIANEEGRTAQSAIMLAHVSDLLFQFLRSPTVVTVAKGDIPPFGPFNRLVTCYARAAILLEEPSDEQSSVSSNSKLVYVWASTLSMLSARNLLAL